MLKNILPKKDEYTGEYQCKVCGSWYRPEEDEDADLSRCGRCNREIDMKVEEKLQKRG